MSSDQAVTADPSSMCLIQLVRINFVHIFNCVPVTGLQ